MPEATDHQTTTRELEAFRQDLLRAFKRGPASLAAAVGLREHDILGIAAYAQQLATEGQLEEARDLLVPLTRLDPPLATVYRCLGAVEMQLDDGDAAVQALRRALELAPDDVASHALLGELFLEQGRLDLAAEHLRASIDLDPEGIDPFASRARSLASIVAVAAREVAWRGPRTSGPIREQIARVFAARAV